MANGLSNNYYTGMFGSKAKKDPSSSQTSEENQALVKRVKESLEFVDRELGALENAIQEISMLREAAQESCSLILRRMSSLRKDATLHEKLNPSLLQQYWSQLGLTTTGGLPGVQQAGPFAGVEGELAVPQPLQQGQG